MYKNILHENMTNRMGPIHENYKCIKKICHLLIIKRGQAECCALYKQKSTCL